MVERFAFRPRGSYALAASVHFLEGFAPAAYGGAAPGHLGPLQRFVRKWATSRQ